MSADHDELVLVNDPEEILIQQVTAILFDAFASDGEAASTGEMRGDVMSGYYNVAIDVVRIVTADAEKRGAVKALRKLDGLERASLWADGTSAFADAIESGAVIL